MTISMTQPSQSVFDLSDQVTQWVGLEQIHSLVMLPNPRTQQLPPPTDEPTFELPPLLQPIRCLKLAQGDVGLTHEYYALESDGHLAAMTLCSIDRTYSLERFELTTLTVHPNLRGLKLGTWLMMHIIQECDKHQPPRVINLMSLKETVDFYKRFGFKRINTGNFEMRRQPRLNLMREVMRPVGRPYMGTEFNEDLQ